MLFKREVIWTHYHCIVFLFSSPWRKPHEWSNHVCYCYVIKLHS